MPEYPLFLRPRATARRACEPSRERDNKSPGRGSGAAQGALKRTSASSAQQFFRASHASAQVNERSSVVRCASHAAPRGHQCVFATDDVSVFAESASICAFNRRVPECRLRWSRSSVAHLSERSEFWRATNGASGGDTSPLRVRSEGATTQGAESNRRCAFKPSGGALPWHKERVRRDHEFVGRKSANRG